MAKGTPSAKTSAVDIAMGKYELGMAKAVSGIAGGGEIVVKKGAKGTGYEGQPQIIQRHRAVNAPVSRKSGRRVALEGCKGKRGCEFVDCVKDALGRVPTNLAKACPTRA